jgi:hypothetical protein
MPAGPATGRVEAKRRALTTLSTAPASKARWCDAWDLACKRDAFFREYIGRTRTRFRSVCEPYSSGESRHEDVHAGGAFFLHDLRAETGTRGTTNDGVNDPVSTAWGHSQSRTPGSFTPSLVHALRQRHRQ